MTVSDTSFRALPAEKSFLRLIFAVTLLGGLAGCGCGYLQCKDTHAVMPALSALCVQFSARGTMGLILTDIFFSVLIVALSFFPCRRLLYCALFFVKGFCICCLIFVFVYFYQSSGFLFAAAVLMFHSFLLLPLQLLAVFYFGFRHNGDALMRFPLASFLALVLLVCIIFDSVLLPKVLSLF